METLDTAANLKYNNGNNFPTNFLYISYAMIGVSIVLVITGSIVIGAIMFFLDLFVLTNRHIVEINEDQNFVHDYVVYLGFIKIGKKYPLNRYKYITAMPLIQSSQAMANYAQTTTISKGYHEINLFGDRLKGKRHVTKFESRTEAQEAAQALANRLDLKYFDYDPKLVREVLLGQRTL